MIAKKRVTEPIAWTHTPIITIITRKAWTHTPIIARKAWAHTPIITRKAWTHTPMITRKAWTHTPIITRKAWTYTPLITRKRKRQDTEEGGGQEGAPNTGEQGVSNNGKEEVHTDEGWVGGGKRVKGGGGSNKEHYGARTREADASNTWRGGAYVRRTTFERKTISSIAQGEGFSGR